MQILDAYIHPTAIVESNVKLGNKVSVWHYCHLREGCIIEDKVSLGKGVFIDKNVTIGKGCRIQNGVNVYHGVKLSEWIFVGPNVTFTNDRNPRAGSSKWTISETILEPGCSLGAGSVITCGLTVGAFSLIGAGSVLTESIPPFHLAYGLPARIISKICACGSTRLGLNTRPEQFIQKCCSDNLVSEVLELAQTQIECLA